MQQQAMRDHMVAALNVGADLPYEEMARDFNVPLPGALPAGEWRPVPDSTYDPLVFDEDNTCSRAQPVSVGTDGTLYVYVSDGNTASYFKFRPVLLAPMGFDLPG